jgi:hypothetical protein
MMAGTERLGCAALPWSAKADLTAVTPPLIEHAH